MGRVSSNDSSDLPFMFLMKKTDGMDERIIWLSPDVRGWSRREFLAMLVGLSIWGWEWWSRLCLNAAILFSIAWVWILCGTTRCIVRRRKNPHHSMWNTGRFIEFEQVKERIRCFHWLLHTVKYYRWCEFCLSVGAVFLPPNAYMPYMLNELALFNTQKKEVNQSFRVA
jgi:hypothetical protein